jgi:antitoxin HicB
MGKRDIGKEILAGLDEIATWKRGELRLKTTTVAPSKTRRARNPPGTGSRRSRATQGTVMKTGARRRTRKRANAHIGSDFEDFLREEGRLEEATALAIKRVLAWEFEQAMKKANISQAEMARRMNTSRAVIRRLLDANDPAITLATISKAATALGKSLRLKLAA